MKRNFTNKIKEQIARCGFNPPARIEMVIDTLKFGQWIKSKDCQLYFSSRYDLYRYLNDEILKNCPIDYLEFGVWKGESMKAWVENNQNSQSRFLGFDSFNGLPEDWTGFTKKNLDESWDIRYEWSNSTI